MAAPTANNNAIILIPVLKAVVVRVASGVLLGPDDRLEQLAACAVKIGGGRGR